MKIELVGFVLRCLILRVPCSEEYIRQLVNCFIKIVMLTCNLDSWLLKVPTQVDLGKYMGPLISFPTPRSNMRETFFISIHFQQEHFALPYLVWCNLQFYSFV